MEKSSALALEFSLTLRGKGHINPLAIKHQLRCTLVTKKERTHSILNMTNYCPNNRVHPHLFFQLVSKRYEVSSIILTSNRGFDEWGNVFGDEVIAAAIIDRLVHHGRIFRINGKSYRVKDKLRKTSDKNTS